VRPAGVAEGAVLSVFRVPPELEGLRVDVFLQRELYRTSRTRTQQIVRASAFDASGRRLRPNDRVRAEQHILLWRPPWDESPVPCDVPVLFEDDHLLAVDKPAMVPVHPTARYYKNTLIKLLEAARPGAFLTLGHRIDRETSGVLLVPKSKECDRALKRQLEARDGVEKTYHAITWDVPHGCDSARTIRLERSLELDASSRYRVKMRVSDAPTARYACTRFAVEDTVRTRAGQTYARVRCHLETGRQHQIRVHLATLGAPIVGDKLYGPDESAFARAADDELTDDDRARLELPRHALHASRIALAHPITGAPLAVEAPLAPDLAAFWTNLTRDQPSGFSLQPESTRDCVHGSG
jgi:23S rRNA pseudouridine1911/1915/1917 synthase